MKNAIDIRKVGVVGGGLIGLSWATLFVARGLEVTVYDPQEAVGQSLKDFVEDAWPSMKQLELTNVDEPILPKFSTSLEDLKDVDFIQENSPDRIEIKRELIKKLEQIVRADVVISSSTSSLIASDIQSEAKHPERILVGHPMNPPHIVPMVELVAGQQTAPEFMDIAEAFYKRVKRVTIRVKKEVIGHLANRLTSALYREAVYIAATGIADVEDIDLAITYGPGLRWALLGPHLTYHLGGGKGGYRHYLDHLGPTQERRWQDRGTVELTKEVKDKLIDGVNQELRGQDVDTLVSRRDSALAEILKIKRSYGL